MSEDLFNEMFSSYWYEGKEASRAELRMAFMAGFDFGIYSYKKRMGL